MQIPEEYHQYRRQTGNADQKSSSHQNNHRENDTSNLGPGRSTHTSQKYTENVGQGHPKKGSGDSSSDEEEEKGNWWEKWWAEESQSIAKRKAKCREREDKDKMAEQIKQLTKMMAGLLAERAEEKTKKEKEKEKVTPILKRKPKPMCLPEKERNCDESEGEKEESWDDDDDYFGPRFLNEMIPNVDITASGLKNSEKLKFAETVDRYLRLPNVSEMTLFEIVRHKLGKYATDTWFDPEYADLPPQKRPKSFLEAFKKKWIRLMDCDDYNKLIQGFSFEFLSDAVLLGLQFEQKCLPYIELADSHETRKAAERIKVCRFRKILGGALMAQMLNVHPAPFETVSEMISVIKELNDRLGITHQAQPLEQSFHMMMLTSEESETAKFGYNLEEEETTEFWNGQDEDESEGDLKDSSEFEDDPEDDGDDWPEMAEFNDVPEDDEDDWPEMAEFKDVPENNEANDEDDWPDMVESNVVPENNEEDDEDENEGDDEDECWLEHEEDQYETDYEVGQEGFENDRNDEYNLEDEETNSQDDEPNDTEIGPEEKWLEDAEFGDFMEDDSDNEDLWEIPTDESQDEDARTPA